MIATSLLHDWFGWDNGSVLTNLVASIIGFIFGGFIVGFFAKRMVARLHSRLDRLHDHVLDLHRHHGVETTRHDDA